MHALVTYVGKMLKLPGIFTILVFFCHGMAGDFNDGECSRFQYDREMMKKIAEIEHDHEVMKYLLSRYQQMEDTNLETAKILESQEALIRSLQTELQAKVNSRDITSIKAELKSQGNEIEDLKTKHENSTVIDPCLGVRHCSNPQDVAESGCPGGFEHHGTRCYKLLALEASWAEARAYCKTFGGDLAIIEDKAEDNLVMGLISKSRGKLYWVAGSDAMIEKNWRWYRSDGASKPIQHFRWAPGQPDNARGAEHCLEMNLQGAFNDRNCNYRESFICEAEYVNGDK